MSKKQRTVINIDRHTLTNLRQALKERLAVKVAFALVLFFLVNIISTSLSNLKLDLTEGNIYSLSPVSREILRKIDTDTDIRFYVSEELLKFAPSYIALEERVRLLLQEMANQNDKINFHYIKPEPFSEQEDEAVAHGIRAVPLNDQGEKVYFGIHIEVRSDHSDHDHDAGGAMPFLQLERESFLEYDIVKLLTELGTAKVPKIAVLSDADPLGYGVLTQGRATPAWAAFENLQTGYEVEYAFSAQNLLEMNPDLVIVAHLSEPSDQFLWAFEQYLLRGGRAIIFADPLFESGVAFGGALPSLNSTKKLNRIFTQWGLIIPDSQVVTDPDKGILVNIAQGQNIEPIVHSAWLSYNQEQINQNDLVMHGLELFNIATSGEIQVKDSGKVQLDVLLKSSAGAQLADAGQFEGSEPDLVKILEEFNAGSGEEKILAARVIGRFEASFGRRPFAVTPNDKFQGDPNYQYPESLKESSAPFQVILVSDADMLQDRFWVQKNRVFGEDLQTKFADNGAMLENAVESLTGAPALGQLRARGVRQRPFVLLENIRLHAERNHRVKANQLSERLVDLQDKISQLQNSPDIETQSFASNQEQLEEQMNLMLETRRALRDVSRNLNRDYEIVNRVIKILNIYFMPIVVMLVGFFVFRHRRRILRKHQG